MRADIKKDLEKLKKLQSKKDTDKTLILIDNIADYTRELFVFNILKIIAYLSGLAIVIITIVYKLTSKTTIGKDGLGLTVTEGFLVGIIFAALPSLGDGLRIWIINKASKNK